MISFLPSTSESSKSNFGSSWLAAAVGPCVCLDYHKIAMYPVKLGNCWFPMVLCTKTNDGSWEIVDFPLYNFHETYQASLTRYKRRPFGYILVDMRILLSLIQLTQIEHAEANGEPIHGIFMDYTS